MQHPNRRRFIVPAVTVALALAAPALEAQVRFAPPGLVNPTTVTVNPSGTTNQFITLGDSEDAIIEFPSTVVTHPVTITGGRRVVVIGGHIDYDGAHSRALAFTRMPAGSIVFVEGMKIDVGGMDGGGDAINADGKAARSPDVYIQNTIITGVHGQSSGDHGDGFQFAGVTTTPRTYHRGYLYIGRAKIDSGYQGAIIAKHEYHDWAQTHVSRFENVQFTYNQILPYDGVRRAYIFWTTNTDIASNANNYVELQNVWMNPFPPLTVEKHHFWPDVSDDMGSYVQPNHAFVSGRIEEGTPATGMTVGSPGGSYTPGSYLSRLDYEGEDTHHSNSGDGFSTLTNSQSSSNEWLLSNANAVGDWVKFQLPALTAGRYTVRVRYLAGPHRGICDFNLGGVTTQIDMYAAADTWKEHAHGPITFSAGDKYATFTVTGKQASSGAFKLSIDRIAFDHE